MLINNIITRGWNVSPLMVLVVGARATTHIPSMKNLGNNVETPYPEIKSTFNQINILAAQYAHSILVHKQSTTESTNCHRPLGLPINK
jgi:hypothetical protein